MFSFKLTWAQSDHYVWAYVITHRPSSSSVNIFLQTISPKPMSQIQKISIPCRTLFAAASEKGENANTLKNLIAQFEKTISPNVPLVIDPLSTKIVQIISVHWKTWPPRGPSLFSLYVSYTYLLVQKYFICIYLVKTYKTVFLSKRNGLMIWHTCSLGDQNT